MTGLFHEAADPTIEVPLRPLAQGGIAILLSAPIVVLGHLIAFGLAQVGEVLGPHPTGNFFYMAGEGLMASVCLGLFLLSFGALTPARALCWLAAFVLWVGAMPAWGILLGGETILFVLVWIFWGTAFLMLLVWLPWWHLRWMSPNRQTQLAGETHEG